MILQKVRDAMKVAMKAKDDIPLQTMRGILSACTNELISKGKKPTDALTDDEVVSVIKRLAKQRKDSAEQFEKGGRPELAQKEQAELKILEAYLPQTASREEIEKVARAKKEELGVTDVSGIGKLTGVVMKEFAGKADGSDVQAVLKSLF